jgi:aromatase
VPAYTATLTHEIAIAAPPPQVFEIVADTAGAPRFAPSQVHAEVQPASDGSSDLTRRWVYDGRSVRSWLTRRVLRRQDLHIEFTHEAPQPPLVAQRGEWDFADGAGGGTRVRVRHAIETVDAAALAAVSAGLNRNVPAQLATYKFVAELGPDRERLAVQHAETATVGGPVGEVVARLAGADVWAALADGPAVAQARPLTDDADLVSVTAGDAARPGSRTDYVRVRLPGTGIAYKRMVLPPGVHAEVGEWRVSAAAAGGTQVRASSWVTLDAGLTTGLAAARAVQQAAVTGTVRRVLAALAAGS